MYGRETENLGLFSEYAYIIKAVKTVMVYEM